MPFSNPRRGIKRRFPHAGARFSKGCDTHQVASIRFFLQAICTEAGLLALRERRMKVIAEDFRKAREKVLYRKTEGTPEGLYL